MDDCKDRDILVVTTTVPSLAQGQTLAQRMEGSPAYLDWVRTELA